MKKIIFISHVPCSSGTYITHWLCSNLRAKYWLIPETSPYTLGNYNRNNSFFHSPALALYAQGYINFEEWKELYILQIKAIVKKWKENKDVPYLIIRNWIFSEYFSLDKSEKTNAKKDKFILCQVLDSLHDDVTPILTHRDPLDCWLGLCASFPQHASKFSIDDYSFLYLQLLRDWNNYENPKKISFTLEEIYSNSNSRKNLFTRLGLLSARTSHDDTVVKTEELSSGASGRKFVKLSIPKRRRISIRGRLLIKRSIHLLQLRSELHYSNHDIDDLNKSFINELQVQFLSLASCLLPKKTFFALRRKLGLLGYCNF